MRIIAHLDMDAFFAAIEERDRPLLRGQPIAVGADPKDGKGRGVVSTANYKAREYGIRSAMPISVAWRLSEAAHKKGLARVIFLPVDMDKYEEVSGRVMAILRKHVEHVEEASVDEAYFDLSFSGSHEKARQLCEKIKEEIKDRERLTCSVGIGPNKLIAKIASDRQKPDGFTVVEEKDAEKFLGPLPARAIPGVGPKTEKRFRVLGVHTIKNLKEIQIGELREMLGKWGEELYYRARGRDESPLIEEWEAKSIGEQETFEKDTLDPNFVIPRLKQLCSGVHERFLRNGFKSFRAVTITVRFADFVTKTRSVTLAAAARGAGDIQLAALKLLMPFFNARENPRKKLIRLIGARIGKLA